MFNSIKVARPNLDSTEPVLFSLLMSINREVGRSKISNGLNMAK
jgi:hypothetical protein